MNETKWPAMKKLFGAYFHQDWIVESGTPEEVLRFFAKNEGPAMASAAAEELMRLYKSKKSVEFKRQLLLDLGCEYAVPEGPAFLDWLRDARRHLLVGTSPDEGA